MLPSRAAWLAMLGLGACQPDARYPGAFQGVIEHDERVLSFEVAGRLVSVAARRGATVQAGEVLAILDDSLARTAVLGREAEAEAARAQTQLVRRGSRIEDIRAAEARLRAATATVDLARKNLARDRSLLAKAAIPRATVDESEAHMQSATAEVQALQQQLRELRRGPRREEIETAVAQSGAADLAARLEAERRDRYRLQALVPGTILEVHLDPGEVAGAGAPVVTIADTTHPYVDVFVPQQALAGIRVGAAATIHVDAVAAALGGSIEDISRRTEFTPRYLFSEDERPNLVVRVRVRIADPDRVLHAGVPAFVTVERAARAPTVRGEAR